MQQCIHRLFFDRDKFTTKQSCTINQNFCDRSPLCGCWLFKAFRAAFLILWHTPRIAMQNSKAANPYPNDCIAVFMFTPLFWPLPPRNSTKQSSFFVRLLLDRADLIPRAANGVHNSLRVQLCFREDHGLVFAPGRTHLFDRAGFAHGVIDMGFTLYLMRS